MTVKIVTLKRGEKIIAVVPEYCAGPGWSNSPTWVYISRHDETLRTVCIQPNERTPILNSLFHAGEAMCQSLQAAVPTRKAKK